MKLEFSWSNFKQYSVTKFHEDPSSGSRVVNTRKDEQRDFTELIVAFRNFAK